MANRMHALRKRAGLTQAELATLLGVAECEVSRWEGGKRALSPVVIERLAAIFKVGSWELFLDRKGLQELAAKGNRTKAQRGDVEVIDQ